MGVQLDELKVLKNIVETDYLSMTNGMEKIFIKKVKKSKSHLAENDAKSAETEIEEYKNGRLYNWDFLKDKLGK